MAILGVLAGKGKIPRRVIETCLRTGRDVVVVAFKGITDVETVTGVRHLWIELGLVAQLFKWLHEQEVTEIIMIGAIRRPSFSELRLDWKALALLARFGSMTMRDGDDSLLKVISKIIEMEGFHVIGVHNVMEDILVPHGILGRWKPNHQALGDIERAVEIAQILGKSDIGQGVVVQQGLVLGVETIEGTDSLLERCGTLRRKGVGGVLVKIKKPQQDSRFDLPTIGPLTIQHASSAGLQGIASQAKESLILDPAETVAAADACGLFLMGIDVFSSV